MEYLQYTITGFSTYSITFCFKPCYKWNTFNTPIVANGFDDDISGFKPCYKWNTFNT